MDRRARDARGGRVARVDATRRVAMRGALAALILLPSAAAAQRASGAGHATSAPAAAVIDSATIWRTLGELAADSMEGRRIGTRGGAAARALLVRRLSHAALAHTGLAPAVPGFEQRFALNGRDGADNTGVNVLAMVRGADTSRVILISAHYDHVGVRNGQVYHGADDNASGTAAVLALAEWYAAHEPRHSMLFAFFDGEEAGLRGARAFAATPPVPLARIAVDVNLDMVSRLDRNELYAAGATPYPFLRPLLQAAAAAAPVKLLLGHDSNAHGLRDNWIDQSDQGVFHAHGVPFIYFGVEDHPDYHAPTDEVGRVNAGRFLASVRTIADVVCRLDTSLDDVVPVRAAR